MARKITFDPRNEEHQKHYELAHVIMMQGRVPLSEAENRRFGGLQDEWEKAGVMDKDERVVDDKKFSAFRYTLDPEVEGSVEIILEDAKWELLKKLIDKTQLSGYVRRPQDALREFVAAAEVFKFERPKLVNTSSGG